MANFSGFVTGFLFSDKLLGGPRVQEKRWRGVVKKVSKWQKFHKERGKDLFTEPVLAYCDGGDFIVGRQEQMAGSVLHHILKGCDVQGALSLHP